MVKVEQLVGWKEAYIEALNTENKDPKELKEPSNKWKKSMLIAEHSPIRIPTYRFFWSEIPYWVAMHLVRHHVGVQPFVGTQRDDRNNEFEIVKLSFFEKLLNWLGNTFYSQKPFGVTSRKKKPQDTPVRLSMVLNANAVINISKERLCKCASKETRDAWQEALTELSKVDSVLYWVCVPKCLYRGFCPERKSCGYINTTDYTVKLGNYRTKL